MSREGNGRFLVCCFYADPVFSRTILFSDFILEKISSPPINAATAMIRKYNFLSVKLSQKLAITPATLPPREVERNHPPINKAVKRDGASLDTSDKPIGLRNISLI